MHEVSSEGQPNIFFFLSSFVFPINNIGKLNVIFKSRLFDIITLLFGLIPIVDIFGVEPAVLYSNLYNSLSKFKLPELFLHISDGILNENWPSNNGDTLK